MYETLIFLFSVANVIVAIFLGRSDPLYVIVFLGVEV